MNGISFTNVRSLCNEAYITEQICVKDVRVCHMWRVSRLRHVTDVMRGHTSFFCVRNSEVYHDKEQLRLLCQAICWHCRKCTGQIRIEDACPVQIVWSRVNSFRSGTLVRRHKGFLIVWDSSHVKSGKRPASLFEWIIFMINQSQEIHWHDCHFLSSE